jgi:hypothetical protein
MKKKSLLYYHICFIFFICNFSLTSAVLFVTSSNDNGNGTLRQCVINAGNNDTIRINVSVINLTGESIRIHRNLTIIGANNRTTINAGLQQIFALTNGHTFHIHNLILQNALVDAIGGAIDVSNSTLFAENCHFINNNANLGGAVSIDDNSIFRANNCLFQDNVALIGGAVSVDNSIFIATECDFIDNIAIADGGAVCISSLYYFTATRCRFIGNTSDGPGAVSMIRGTFTATDCEFRENKSIESAGGVGVFGGSSIFNAERCDFIENTTNNGGGGVAVIKGTFNAEFCLFEWNVADSNGGAVYIDSSASFIAKSCDFVENVQTFYRNWERSHYGGGAIYIN